MIGRKTALVCAALIALMFAAAVARIIGLDDWTTLVLDNRAKLPSLLLFFFPACSALVVGALYRAGIRAGGAITKVRPWHRWGEPLSLGYCAGLLVLQCVVIVETLDLHLQLSALARALGVLLAIMSLLAVNRMPKLPYLERAFGPGAELGPIYGPRYVRIVSRILVAFMIAAIVYSFAATPSMAWLSTPVFLLATAGLMVWSIVWRRHLSRKWSLEQSARRG